MCSKIVLCIFVVLLEKCVPGSAVDDVIIPLNLTKYRPDPNEPYWLSCIERSETTIVYEGTDLKIQVYPNDKRNDQVDIIECIADEKKIFQSLKTTKNLFVVKKIKKDYEGMWYCTIYIDKEDSVDAGNSLIKPRDLKGKYSYAVANCFTKVHVRVLETPHKILVNNAILSTIPTRLQELIIDHYVEYKYLIGDMIDVSCINFHNNCVTVNMNYYYSGIQHDDFKTEDVQSEKGVGFRSKLRAEHDNSRMLCTCTNEKYNTTAQVIFKLNEHFNHKLNVTINGHTMTHGVRTTEVVATYKFEYMFYEGETVNIIFHTNLKETSLYSTGCGIKSGTDASNTKTIELLSPSRDCELICTLSHRRIITETIKIKFTTLPTRITEPHGLSLNLAQNNILMELYEHERKRLIYFEYDEDLSVVIKCSITDVNDTKTKVIEFDGEEKWNLTTFTTPLIEMNDKMKHEFVLKEFKTVGKIINDSLETLGVIFIKKRVRITTTTTEATTTTTVTSTIPNIFDKDVTINPITDKNLIRNDENTDSGTNAESNTTTTVVVVGVLVCILLITAFLVVCHKKKRKQQRNQDEPTYANSQLNTETRLPHPPQWASEQNYAVPTDHRNENIIYTEPVGNTTQTYAVPIPKGERQKNSVTYATVDFSNKRPSKQFADERSQYATVDLYSQVMPKSERRNNTYDNVFSNSQYENSNSRREEYVEPTYCEATYNNIK